MTLYEKLRYEKIDYVMLNTSGASRYEMLAEEAVELAHVAQKIARYLRGEQPISLDMTPGKLRENLIEEYADVSLAFDAITGADSKVKAEVFEMNDQKLKRWYNRLREREDNAEKID